MKNILKKFKVNSATYYFIILFFITGYIKNCLLIYLIVITHELGHIIMTLFLGYNIEKVEVYPFGGYTTIKKDINDAINKDILIYTSGVLNQIILFLIFNILIKHSLISISSYKLFLEYNKTIFVFNLLPIIPLDGYYIVRLILEKFISYYKAFKLSFFISFSALIFFIIYNITNSLNNYLIIGFIIYKIVYEYKNFNYFLNCFYLERYLNKYSNKIIYSKGNNLKKLRKEKYHYFFDNTNLISETDLLRKRFDK